eukprot:4650747-Pyramimonas_sp.AAC.1
MHEDRAQFLVDQINDVTIAIDGRIPASEWASLDRALRFWGKPPNKSLAFPSMLDDEGVPATTHEKIAHIAQ